MAMESAAVDDDTKERLAQAEASMQKQLSKVDKERTEVEKAVADLQRVQSELEGSSNILKPASLAGVLLFSVRAVLDFVAMTGGGIDSEAHMTAAFIQGAIALVCAGYFLFAWKWYSMEGANVCRKCTVKEWPAHCLSERKMAFYVP